MIRTLTVIIVFTSLFAIKKDNIKNNEFSNLNEYKKVNLESVEWLEKTFNQHLEGFLFKPPESGVRSLITSYNVKVKSIDCKKLIVEYYLDGDVYYKNGKFAFSFDEQRCEAKMYLKDIYVKHDYIDKKNSDIKKTTFFLKNPDFPTIFVTNYGERVVKQRAKNGLFYFFSSDMSQSLIDKINTTLSEVSCD